MQKKAFWIFLICLLLIVPWFFFPIREELISRVIIRKGMSPTLVEKILGKPDSSLTVGRFGRGEIWKWFHQKGTISVVFVDDKVDSVSFVPSD